MPKSQTSQSLSRPKMRFGATRTQAPEVRYRQKPGESATAYHARLSQEANALLAQAPEQSGTTIAAPVSLEVAVNWSKLWERDIFHPQNEETLVFFEELSHMGFAPNCGKVGVAEEPCKEKVLTLLAANTHMVMLADDLPPFPDQFFNEGEPDKKPHTLWGGLHPLEKMPRRTAEKPPRRRRVKAKAEPEDLGYIYGSGF